MLSGSRRPIHDLVYIVIVAAPRAIDTYLSGRKLATADKDQPFSFGSEANSALLIAAKHKEKEIWKYYYSHLIDARKAYRRQEAFVPCVCP